MDIRRISTGGFYNFPALFQLAPGFSNQYRDLLETHIGQCKDKSPDTLKCKEIMTDRLMDQPTDQQTSPPNNRRIGRLIGKLHFQQEQFLFFPFLLSIILILIFCVYMFVSCLYHSAINYDCIYLFQLPIYPTV